MRFLPKKTVKVPGRVSSTKKRTAHIARIILTLTLLIVLSLMIDVDEFVLVFSSVSMAIVISAFCLLVLQNVLLSLRWLFVMRVLGLRLNFVHAATIYHVGLFFNQILPTSIGGDVIRAWLIRDFTNDTYKAVEAVLIDRVTGLLALLALFLGCLPLLLPHLPFPSEKAFALAVAAVAILAVVTSLLLDLIEPVIRRLFGNILAAQFSDFSKAARRVTWSKTTVIPVLGVAIIVHMLTAGTAYVLGLGMDMNLPLSVFLVAIPPIMLFAMLPISLGGWGVREVSMISVLGYFDVETERAFALSLCIGFLLAFSSIPGGIIWLSGRRSRITSR